MKYKWLNKKQNESLIVFFNGWGMDESVVSLLDCENFDVIMFYDYNSLDVDFDFQNLEKYKTKHLVAWSMGVMTASLFNIKYFSKTAINGTLKPIDNKFGIPERIYDLTIRGFDEKGAERFIKNIFNETCDLPKINRTIENQKSELFALKTYSANPDFKYTKVLISNYDKIIPTQNQCAFWGIEPNLNTGHCPFLLFKKWSELL